MAIRRIFKKPTSFFKNRIATFFPGNSIVHPSCSRELVGRVAAAPFIIAISPVIVIVGLYSFVTFGFSVMINLLLTVFLQTPEAEGGYGFSPLQNAACMYFNLLPNGESSSRRIVTFNAWLGIIIAQVVGWSIGDAIPLSVSRRFGHGVWRPEYRLWNIIIPGIVSPIGLGIFGAALQYHLHFMILALGLFLVVFAATLSVPICINYATECFLMSASEVAVTMNMYRLGFSIALGFFLFPWRAAVGAGWVFGIGAFFEIFVGILVTLLIWKGQALRKIPPKGFSVTEDGEKVELSRNMEHVGGSSGH